MEFVIERARSALSKCKGCGNAIPKDAPRLGIRPQTGAGITAWYDLDAKCIKKFRKAGEWWQEHFVRDQISINDECVSGEELDQLIESISQLKDEDDADSTAENTPAGEKKKRGAAESTSTSHKRSNAQALPEFDGGVLSEEQISAIIEKMNELKGKTNSHLQGLLRSNNQKISGKKEELIVRVAELAVLGGLPKCPECSKAVLHFNRATGEYTCPGSHERGHMVKCAFKSDAVERIPWEE